MPAILTESGFMDNMVEAKDMLDPDFQRADAEGTCKGICKTFGVKYVEPKKEEEKEYNKDKENNEVDTDVKYIKVIVKELNIRSVASWDENAVSGIVREGEVFTVEKKVKVDSSYMYKLKSGYFITASPKYVQEIKR